MTGLSCLPALSKMEAMAMFAVYQIANLRLLTASACLTRPIENGGFNPDRPKLVFSLTNTAGNYDFHVFTMTLFIMQKKSPQTELNTFLRISHKVISEFNSGQAFTPSPPLANRTHLALCGDHMHAAREYHGSVCAHSRACIRSTLQSHLQ